MKIRLASLVVLAVVLLSWTAPAWTQDKVDPKTLIGKWVWQPARGHTFTLEFTDVSSTGIATGTYQHPNGRDPFKKKVIDDDGTVKFQVGRQIKMDLEYDRTADALVGPASGWGPRASTDFHKAYFKREK
jgi:hypothetical protein